ncbi:hypothetical protein [Terrisporobacter vanillatitrophus]|uniref:hypothetical protein n=1 Tax=Terrisporobacter vanillatitrophus TaxID=3058402 RepID=UPI0033673337
MNTKIINYTDITKIDRISEFNIIKDTLHICAASSTTKAMYKCYGNKMNAPILSVGNITKSLVDEWESSVVKLSQYTNLTRIIKELVEVYKETKSNYEEYNELLRGFRRNQKEVLNSIRSLVECNIYPHEFNCETIEDEVFKDIWNGMETDGRDQSILAFRNEFYSNLNRKDKFEKKFKKALTYAQEKEKVNIEKYNIKDIKRIPNKIVLHGFYYIRPIQDRMIKLIEDLGIEIIYLNWYDNKYPKIFEIWDKTFDEKFGYPNFSERIYKDNKINYRWCDLFAGIYEGNISDDDVKEIDKSTLDIKSYDNIMTFLNDYNEIENYFSPVSNDINNLFKDYYPERYNSRHLLSYPIGQFLYQLHLMWDDNESQIILDFNSIEEYFSSGWLSIKKDGKTINARDYTYDLYCIKEYFNNCRTIDEWKDRLVLLKYIKDNIVSNMDSDCDKLNINYRFHKMASNPFLNFSFFSIDENRLDDISNFINKIIDIGINLFNEDKETNLEKYFKKLDKVIESNDFSLVDKVEQDIVNEIRNKLSYKLPYEVNCFPEDIAEGLILFLGGKFEEDENDKKESDKSQIVEPLEKIESSYMLCDEGETIHICQVSEHDIPGGKMSYSWPLNKYNLGRLELNDENKNRLLKRMKLIVEDRNLINRYLFYCALHSEKKIKISWIKNVDGEKLEQSIFIKLLKTWVEELKYQTKEDEVIIGKKKDYKSREVLKIDRSYIESMISECKTEFSICPRRFYYSYIVDDIPTYTSDFHHKFGFTRLGSAISISSNKSSHEVFNNINNLFPQWRDVEKLELKEEIWTSGNSYYDEYEGKEYTTTRMYTHFLYPKYKEFKCDSIDIYETKNPVIFNAVPEKGDKCLYCQHSIYCKDGILPLDREGDK